MQWSSSQPAKCRLQETTFKANWEEGEEKQGFGNSLYQEVHGDCIFVWCGFFLLSCIFSKYSSSFFALLRTQFLGLYQI